MSHSASSSARRRRKRAQQSLPLHSLMEQAIRSPESWSFPQGTATEDEEEEDESLRNPTTTSSWLQTLTYPGSVDESLVCPICKCYMVAPSVTPCRHAFCHTCLKQHLDLSETCPMDRTRLRLSSVKPSPELVELLDKLEVLCPNSSLGCGTKLKRAEVAGHVGECRYSQQQQQQQACSPPEPVCCPEEPGVGTGSTRRGGIVLYQNQNVELKL